MTTAATGAEDKVGFGFASEAKGRELFDFQARSLLGISGDEFLARWDRGEYREIADTPGNLHIGYLAMLIPFARSDS